MSMSSYLTVRLVEALEKAAEAAKTAADAYARDVEKRAGPEYVVHMGNEEQLEEALKTFRGDWPTKE